MAKIQWIVFSKNRTLQVKSLILSLLANSDIDARDVTVIYVDSDKISYEPLKKELSCRFIRQTDFYSDVMDILTKAPRPYTGFLVDDLIIRDYVSSDTISALMDSNSDLDCFSLRLGSNIKDTPQPDFSRIAPGIISWYTAAGLGRLWNYYFENSSSVYRTVHMADYMAQLPSRKVTFPNPMEFKYYDMMPNHFTGSGGLLRRLAHPKHFFWRIFCPASMSKRMACYEKSRAFTQGVNLVAARGLDYKAHASTETLHGLFLEGYRIDFECLKDVEVSKPNAGQKYFRLVNGDGSIHPLSLYQPA